MRTYFFILGVLALTSTASFAFTLPPIPTNLPPLVIQDSKTKITYYLESDRRHVSAIDPDGKLLWFCEVVPDIVKSRVYIESLDFDKDENKIYVSIWMTGQGGGTIDKKTGKFWQNPVVQ
jgi:hypothetical protein